MTIPTAPSTTSPVDLSTYLRPTPTLDANHPRIVDFVRSTTEGVERSVPRAVRLFYAVRDGLRYDPYAIDMSEEGMRASTVLQTGRGYCVTKAGVLAAAARCAGIPARVGFADVRNHLATPRLLEMMGTDVFYYHGYTELFLEGRLVKATPAFNRELCERFGVLPLEFDGRTDSLFQPFDARNRRHMEYLRDRGPRDDLPLQELREAMIRCYPNAAFAKPSGTFEEEIPRNTPGVS